MMTFRFAALTLVLATASLASPATAADWGYDNGGIKDYQGGEAVPVPAPVPIPIFEPSWYFRFDAGLGVINDPDVSAQYDFVPGNPLGENASYTPPSSWFGTDFDTFLTLGAGVGYYFGNGFRGDLQVEKRSKDDFVVRGSDDFVTHGFDCCGVWNPVDFDNNGVGDSRSQIEVRERGRLDGTVWTANLYYDFHTKHNFTPYIGAGLGFVWNEISRKNTTTFFECTTDNVDHNVCDPNGAGYIATSGPHTSSDKADKVSLAAAAMAGFSYQVTDITSVDMGYRYLYLQGTDAVLDVNGRKTRVEIDDQHVHQLRAGLRFDVN